MKITKSNPLKIKIEEVERLDPITVILEDLEPGKGKIIIECYGESWSSYWGGMGDRTISEFFCSCDNDYLAKNLDSGIPQTVDDEEKWDDEFDISLKQFKFEEYERGFSLNCPEIPQKPNPKYEYLSRILDTVKEALKELKPA
ncbi:hypothetical protein KAR91_38295 [Candidatus Pacearchaeota archaeon]|nr:hypothetical protein [Candidatus Pacearchaeota archaeon]